MKERPILFSGEMVQAILAGKKTQTRRVVKSISGYSEFLTTEGDIVSAQEMLSRKPKQAAFLLTHCPYGRGGDRLWVRETFAVVDQYNNNLILRYKAEGDEDYHVTVSDAMIDKYAYANFNSNWRPSIFMPRWASRINLEIVNVRVERLKEITEQDIAAEGILPDWHDHGFTKSHSGLNKYPDYYKPWIRFWDGINEKRGFGWYSNPWVWVIEFKRV